MKIRNCNIDFYFQNLIYVYSFVKTNYTLKKQYLSLHTCKSYEIPAISLLATKIDTIGSWRGRSQSSFKLK